jgi:hypothetical protein
MSNVTSLSSGSLNGQALTIELVERGNDLPIAVVVRWPQKPTITSPAAFDKVVADVMKILSNAVVELAALKVWKSCERRRSPGRSPPRTDHQTYFRLISQEYL